jgi:hypothetical protein
MSPRFNIPSFTSLIVVEGECEEALCLYLKSFKDRCGRFEIRNAHGGSPDVQVSFAKRLLKRADYDELVLMLDSDQKMSESSKAWLKKQKAIVVLAVPNLEGELLRLLGKKVPAEPDACQKDIATILKCQNVKEAKQRISDRQFWAHHFSISQLQEKRILIIWLDTLLKAFHC